MRWGRTSKERSVPREHWDMLRGIPLVSLRHAVVVAEVLPDGYKRSKSFGESDSRKAEPCVKFFQN